MLNFDFTENVSSRSSEIVWFFHTICGLTEFLINGFCKVQMGVPFEYMIFSVFIAKIS